MSKLFSQLIRFASLWIVLVDIALRIGDELRIGVVYDCDTTSSDLAVTALPAPVPIAPPPWPDDNKIPERYAYTATTLQLNFGLRTQMFEWLHSHCEE